MAGGISATSTEQIDVSVVHGLDEKTQKEIVKTDPVRFAKQQVRMKEIFAELSADHFDAKGTYEDLREYIGEYKRILYSIVSHSVYDIEKAEEENEKGREKQTSFDTLLHNLEALLDYVNDKNNVNPEKGTQSAQNNTRETIKAIWKLWDHINLAHRQFQVLRVSEGDYKKRFEEQVNAVEAKTIKESTSQMLTVVGIFTALAFVTVGGISSLGNILSGIQNSQILKLLIIACVWGIGMLNVVFVFLFGIGKLTKQELKSSDSDKKRERYPVYFWANYILVALIAVFGWLYFSHNRASLSWLDGLINWNPEVVGATGLVLILLIIGLIAYRLIKGKWPLLKK